MEEKNDGISQELVNEILKNVCVVLNITEPILPDNATEEQQNEYTKNLNEYNSKISLLIYYIIAICNNILIKTNRNKFPEPLKYVVVDLTKNKFDSNNSNDPELKSITSMSEYDRSVSFGASDLVKARINLIAQKQVEENEILINRFKLLYKT